MWFQWLTGWYFTTQISIGSANYITQWTARSSLWMTHFTCWAINKMFQYISYIYIYQYYLLLNSKLSSVSCRLSHLFPRLTNNVNLRNTKMTCSRSSVWMWSITSYSPSWHTHIYVSGILTTGCVMPVLFCKDLVINLSALWLSLFGHSTKVTPIYLSTQLIN